MAGGVGITPMMSLFSYFINCHNSRVSGGGGQAKSPVVWLVWIGRYEENVVRKWYPKVFAALEAMAEDTQKLFRLTYFCTSQQPSKEMVEVDTSRSSTTTSSVRCTPQDVRFTPSVSSSTTPQDRQMTSNVVQAKDKAKAISTVEFQRGRPDLSGLMRQCAKTGSVQTAELGMLACGPAPLIRLVQYRARSCGAHFHQETFFL